jgi:hypothetical protein
MGPMGGCWATRGLVGGALATAACLGVPDAGPANDGGPVADDGATTDASIFGDYDEADVGGDRVYMTFDDPEHRLRNRGSWGAGEATPAAQFVTGLGPGALGAGGVELLDVSPALALPLTIEAWIDLTSTDGCQELLGQYLGGTPAAVLHVVDGGLVLLSHPDDTEYLFPAPTNRPTIEIGWHHIAMTWREVAIGARVSLYVDGERKLDDTFSHPFVDGAADFHIGQTSATDGDCPPIGSIDEVKVSSVRKSDGQIALSHMFDALKPR